VRYQGLAILLFASAAAGAGATPPDAKTLFTQSIRNYDRDWRAGMTWGYTETDTVRKDGKKEVVVSEVIPLDGTPYDRVVSKNGKPLSPAEQRKEDEKFAKEAQRRKNESASERQARIRKYENERSFLKDLPNAYNFQIVGDEVVDGRSAWVMLLKRRPEFEPTTSRGGMLKHIEGKLWIDKEDTQWAKAEAHVTDPISIGWIVARIDQGAEIKLDMTRVVNGLWMPEKIDIDGRAKVLMVHNKVLDEHLSFSGYHRGGNAMAAAKRGE
jgi:hypothetical protein